MSAPTHGTVVLNTQPNPQNNTITFTPEAGYTGPASFSYTISDGRGGTATASVNLTVVPPGAAPVGLFNDTVTPALTGYNDGSPLEVGMKFTSSVAGQITALQFYRNASDTGSNVVDLWTSTGTLLGSATFTNTSASGWQTVTLSSAVSIAANTTYIASYHTTGAYVATNNYFTTAVTNGPLTAPSTTTIAGGNGVYSYGGTATTGIFPTNTYSAANYWVDVVFTPSGAGNIGPTAAADIGDATEKGGTNNGTGGSTATGNVLTNDTDPNAGDSKTVSAVNFGATAGTLGAALAGAYGSLLLNASGHVHLYSQRSQFRRAGAAAIDQHVDRGVQLHHARHRRRHVVDNAYDHHPRRKRRAGACGPDRRSERDCRLDLLPDAPLRHIHGRRWWRHIDLRYLCHRRVSPPRMAHV